MKVKYQKNGIGKMKERSVIDVVRMGRDWA
jgi:hypothetical protein